MTALARRRQPLRRPRRRSAAPPPRASRALSAEATRRVRAIVGGGRAPFRRAARARSSTPTHGLAWLATYGEAVRELAAYAERLAAEGRLGETEDLLVRIGLGEYLDQIFGGIPMSQGEIVRLPALGLSAARGRPLPGRMRSRP